MTQKLRAAISWLKCEYDEYEASGFDCRWGGYIVVALALSALLFSVTFLFLDYEVDSDVAKSYTYLLRAFHHREWNHFFNPNLPLLTPFLAALLRECFPVLEPFQALILMSGIYFALSVPVLYGFLLQNLNKRGLALLGTMLFCFAPQTIRIAGNGWLEVGRNFYVLLSIFLIGRQLRDFSVGRSFLFGAVLSALSLSRGEGVFFAMLLLAFGLIVLRFERHSNLRQRLGGFLLPALSAFLIPLLLYSFVMYRITGFLVTDRRIVAVAQALLKSPKVVAPGRDLTVDYFTMSFADAVGDFFQGGEYVYVSMALVGILLLIVCRKWRCCHTLCLILAVVNFVGCWNLVTQYRYFTLNTPVLMIFTVTTAGFVYHLALSYLPFNRKIVKTVAAIGLTAMLLGEADKGLSYWRRGDPESRKIGRFLNSNREKIWGSRCPLLYSNVFGYSTHIDCRIMNRYLVRLPDLSKTDLLDGAVLRFGEKIKREGMRREVEQIRRRHDFERVITPYDDRIEVYRRKGTVGVAGTTGGRE